ncbi:hypothetical protein Ndes2437B_g06814 [Nannochloris sp. 'desiccata']
MLAHSSRIGLNKPDRGIHSSPPTKALKTSFYCVHRLRPCTRPFPPAPLKWELRRLSSLNAIPNDSKMYNLDNKVAVTALKPCASTFPPKSPKPETLVMAEKMLTEAQKAYPGEVWEIIWPLPDHPGVISVTSKVFRWVDPTNRRQNQPGCDDNQPVVSVLDSLPGWKIEATAPPDVPRNIPPTMEDQVRVRHLLREPLISKGNITLFKRRKALDEPVQEDCDRSDIYNYLKNGLVGAKCRVRLFDNWQTDHFMVLCRPEKAEESKGKKPLMLLFEGNFGRSLDIPMIIPNLELSLYLADIFGWRCEKIVLKNWGSRAQIEETVELVQRWCAADRVHRTRKVAAK